jgi:hypothetical protein
MFCLIVHSHLHAASIQANLNISRIFKLYIGYVLQKICSPYPAKSQFTRVFGNFQSRARTPKQYEYSIIHLLRCQVIEVPFISAQDKEEPAYRE